MWHDLLNTTVKDYKRCLEAMRAAHPFSDDARMYISPANPEAYPCIGIVLDIDGTEITMKRKVEHERELGNPAKRSD